MNRQELALLAKIEHDYRPDFRHLASGQLKAARAALRLDTETFAAFLAAAVGWTPGPGVVERWEEGAPPPGDILLAADWMNEEMREPAPVVRLAVVR